MATNKHEKGSSLFWAFILIVVGVAFLFQNLGLLSGNVWNTLFRLWPLLIILLGVNDLVHNRGIVGPTLAIGIGSIFVVSNFGYLNWDAWMTMLRLWPILIIAIGLEIFIGRKNLWLSAIGVGIALSLLAVGVWFSGGIIGKASAITPVANSSAVVKKIEQPLAKTAKSAEVVINASLGKLTIASLSDSENFIKGEIHTVEQETIVQNYELTKGEISYFLSSDWEPNTPNPLFDFDENRLYWELFFTDEIPLNLDISLGVGESNLDLRNLQLTELLLNIGVGQTRVELPRGKYQADIDGGVGQSIVTLPDEGQIKLIVNGGVGEIIIYIPKDMATKIYIEHGFASLTLPDGYTQDEDVYTSPNYKKGNASLELYLDQGVGNIAIREK